MISPSTVAVVPAATTSWLSDRLAEPSRDAVVVHVGRDAVYLDDGGRCIGILARAAVRVPCGLQTALDDLTVLGELHAAEPARVGDGRVGLGETDVVVARLFDARVPELTHRSAGPRPGAREALARVTAELGAAALEMLAAGTPAAVSMLLGRGSGLTPLGDDVLCGWMAASLAAGRPAGPVAAEVDRLAATRTTVLSATLLECAARGEVLPELRAVLVGAPLDMLVRVGHTSGAGLATGLLLAERAA
jgi:hypothetical protein